MKVEVIASTKVGYVLPKEEAIDFSGKSAGICYLPDTLETLFSEITGKELAPFYRPPRGKYSTDNLRMAMDCGYHTFFWSLAYVDWYEDDQPTKEEAFDKLVGRIHPGAIVLLHNTSATNGAILDELLSKWEEMGYRFSSLSDFLP